MESLLSVAFDNISSRDSGKIRKGLRQIEGLLAQICMSPVSAPVRSPNKRKSSALSDRPQPSSPKQLRELGNDPAFREFFRLQEGFQWNVASRLLSTLERLMGMGNPSSTDLLILSTLDLLQGTLLLHPPSRHLFTREITMNLLLDLLDPSSNPPKIQSLALLVLVTALLDCPRNTRTFEAVDGLLTITSLFKSRGSVKTTREVRLRTLEFLYFYLLPEVPASPARKQPLALTTQPVRSGPSLLGAAFAGHARTHSGDGGIPMDVDGEEADDEMDDESGSKDTRSTDEKQKLLGKHLTNVAELVQDLREGGLFGVQVA